MDYQEERGSGETLSYYIAMIAPEFWPLANLPRCWAAQKIWERERWSHEPGHMRNLVGPCKGIQRGRHASRFECTSCSTASHSSAVRNARPCLADGRFTLRSTYSSTCPQHHQQQPILANNGPLRLQSLLRSVAAFETILLSAAPPPLPPGAAT